MERSKKAGRTKQDGPEVTPMEGCWSKCSSTAHPLGALPSVLLSPCPVLSCFLPVLLSPLLSRVRQVCDDHGVKVLKKAPSISDLNDALKTVNVIDVPQWRFVQHLGDLRNLCDHNKKVEPTTEQVDDLVTGVAKVIKTLF
jgi:hypothetical protein